MTMRGLQITVELLVDRGDGLVPERRSQTMLLVDALAMLPAGAASEIVHRAAIVQAGRMWDEVVLMGYAGGG